MNPDLPDTIYLQWFGDAEPHTEPVAPGSVTWHHEQVFPHDLKFQRIEKYLPKKKSIDDILTESGSRSRQKEALRTLIHFYVKHKDYVTADQIRNQLHLLTKNKRS